MMRIKSKVGLRLLAGGLLWLLALGTLAAQTKIGELYYGLDETDKMAMIMRGKDNAGSYIKYSGDIVIPASVTYNGTTYVVVAIDENAFSDCTGLTSIEIPSSVTTIGARAFSGCTGLTSIEIPSSVTTIGARAFSGCTGLTSIEFPATLDSVGSSAFEGCTGLTQVTIADRGTALYFGVGGSSCDAFKDCPIQSLYMGGDVSFRVSPFRNLTTLETLTIGDSVTEIGSYAFYGCTGLTSIDFSNSVTEIGSYAFDGCTGLQTVVLGKSVAYIREKAFMDCIYLKSLTAKADVPADCGANAFLNVSTIQCELIVPEASVELYKSAPGWKDFLRVTGKDLSDRIYVTALRLEPDGASLRVGEGLPLRAVVTPDSATEQTVVWSSSDKNVLRVDNDGYVMAVAAGEAVITARTTDGSNLSATCTVTVTAAGSGGDGGDPGGGDDGDNILVETLSVSTGGASTELKAGGTLQLRAVVTPSNATNKAVAWSSSNKKVATVDNDGYVVALAAGTVVITACTTDGTDISATCTLTVTAAGSGGDGGGDGPGGGNTAVEVPDALQAVRVYAADGHIEVRGLPLGTAVTLSGVDGRLWYQTEAVTGPELSLVAPRGHVYVLRLNNMYGLKVYLP